MAPIGQIEEKLARKFHTSVCIVVFIKETPPSEKFYISFGSGRRNRFGAACILRCQIILIPYGGLFNRS